MLGDFKKKKKWNGKIPLLFEEEVHEVRGSCIEDAINRVSINRHTYNLFVETP